MPGNVRLSAINASGGKPPFLTCEFLSLQWYPRSISFFHNFGSGLAAYAHTWRGLHEVSIHAVELLKGRPGRNSTLYEPKLFRIR